MNLGDNNRIRYACGQGNSKCPRTNISLNKIVIAKDLRANSAAALNNFDDRVKRVRRAAISNVNSV